MRLPLKHRIPIPWDTHSIPPPTKRRRYPIVQIWLATLLVFVALPIFADEPLINGDAEQINNDVTDDARHTRKRTRDLKPGNKKEDASFTLGYKGSDYWIDKKANSDLQTKKNGDVFFAYVLGKENHTSALVRAHTSRVDGEDNVTFKFEVIQGQIDSDGESKIDFMTELTVPDNFGGQVAFKTNAQTLPDWEENSPSQAKTPDMITKISGNHDRTDGWTEEFEVKKVSSDPSKKQHIINIAPDVLSPPGYYLASVKGGSNATKTTSWDAYCLIHSYRDDQNVNKARLLILDDGTIDNDGDVYINEVNLAEESLLNRLPSNRSENFDNVWYKNYQDGFLLELKNKGDLSNKNSNKILADYLPSHLLYSPEDYTWDALRFKLVKNGEEELINSDLPSSTKSHYQDVCDFSGGPYQCTIGEMLKAAPKLPDNQRTPILFIHGWQGALDKSNAFGILHEYRWGKISPDGAWVEDLVERPTSGEAYWRNLLTYMYRHHNDEFAKYKPYVYHYPTYKHVKFNARMLKELLDELKTSGDEVIKNGIASNNLIIIGHSMGTIVSRSLMEEAGYLPHVKRFISLAGVHHGSPGAIASLMDTVDNFKLFVQKDLYTPGACDLMSDNYDGFFDANIKSDIETNNVVNTKELLEQREVCGSVFTANDEYDLKRSSFDRFYLQKLGIENNFYLRKEMKVPFHPNPWLLNLNKNHYTKHREDTKNKYYFYAGYVVTTSKVPSTFSQVTRFSFPNERSSYDLLTDDTIMDKITAFSVAKATNYQYNDAVVPVSYGILDTSRGRLLQDGNLNASYDIVQTMPDDIKEIHTTLERNNISDIVSMLSSNLADVISVLNSYNIFIVRGKNDWGAEIRIFGDYNHDRLLNGGYSDIQQYRTGTGRTGTAHNNFDDYYVSVTGQQPPNTNHFANDPVFVQIARDLNGAIEPPIVSVDITAHDFESRTVNYPPLTQDFVITNTGGYPLEVDNIVISGDQKEDFTLADITCSEQVPFSLLFSETCVISIGFAPQLDGEKQATLSIMSNDPNTPQLDISLTGIGEGEIDSTINQGTTDCTQVTEIPQAECEALLALYNSTNGPNWSDSPANNWNVTNTPCNWMGVGCREGHVIFIIETEKGLTGSIPDLSALSNLVDISLAANQLSGGLSNLIALTNLQMIDLSYNQLSEQIPDLSSLNYLKGLDLSNNKLSGTIPTSLYSLFLTLQFLNLDNNCLETSTPTWSFLDNKNPTWKTTQTACTSTDNEVPNYISGSVNPTTINVGESVKFETVWHDPENDFIVDVRVKYCQQETSECEVVTLAYIEGTEHPTVGFETQVSILKAGTYAYQFLAFDANPVENLLHSEAELEWHDGGIFNVSNLPTQNETDCTQSPEIPQTECKSNSFVQTTGENRDDRANAVQQTADGGYIVTGWINYENSVLLLKYDHTGQLEWSKSTGGAKKDVANAVQQTADGGYIVAGYRMNGLQSDVLLLKYDSTGVVEWTRSININGSKSAFNSATSVQQTSDEGYIVTGRTGLGSYDIFLLKYDNSGTLEWSKVFGTSADERANSVRQTFDGGYIVVGTSYTTDIDILLIKYDSSGEREWEKTIDGGEYEEAYSVQSTSDNGYIVVGHTDSYNEDGNFDILLLKYTSVDQLEWAKVIAGNKSYQARSVQQTTDGGYIITGFNSDWHAFLLKTDDSGNPLWTKLIGDDKTNQAYSVQQTTDGGYVLAGQTYSYGEGGDVLLVKTDANGDIDGCNLLQSVSLQAQAVFPETDDIVLSAKTFSLSTEVRSLSNPDLSLTSTMQCGIQPPVEPIDTDGDGINDDIDTDDDGDGVADTDDVFPLDANESLDTDGDGIGDNTDTDDDGDGTTDTEDAFPLDANESVDTDGDGMGNNADTDDDGDGIADTEDALPLDANESVDTDGDGIGNNADTDDDGDGVLDTEDVFPLDANESVDTDGDSIGNNADTDDDNDGMPDTFELAKGFDPLDASDANNDADNDGYSNLAEYQANTDPKDAQSLPVDLSKVRFVDSGVSTSGNGTSWTQAFKTLQEAVEAVPDKGEIWVKQGTYVLSSSIYIEKPVAIYGGFAGSETDKSQRDWEANVTIIKEGINFDSADGTIIDGFTISNSGIITVGETQNMTIIHCQFKKGGIDSYDYSDVTISHSIFSEGAGISNWDSKMTVAHSTFSQSNIGNEEGSSMAISHSNFDEIAITNHDNSDITITNANIGNSNINNSSSLAIENSKLSNTGISNSYSVAELTNCSFDGKGIYNSRSNVSLTNCTVSNMIGTAVINEETFLYITHGTFYNNGIAISNAGSESGASSVDITNSVFWRNGTAIINDPGEFEMGYVNIAYSNISDSKYEGEGIEEGEGNINADPLFVDAAGGNFRLKANSPAIDTGISDEEAPTTDIEGNPRPFGDGYDMGAYEYGTVESGPNHGDGNGDGILDSQQDNVSTIPSAVGDTYLTLEAKDCNVQNVKAKTEADASAGMPDGAYEFPQGLISFELPSCGSSEVMVYYHGVTDANDRAYRKYGPTTPGDANTKAWYTLPNVTFGTATVGDQTVATATFTLTDGQLGDDTGVDGIIIDDGGTAIDISNETVNSYRANGTILDKFGNPIAGVSIEVNGKTTLTDENGYWEINGLAEGHYTVTAHKAGYLFDARDIAVGNDQNETVIFKTESVLDVNVIAQPSPVKQGDNVIYTMTITNRGNETATGIVLTETLPENTHLIRLEGPANGHCDLDTMTCIVPDLSANETAMITVVVSNAQTAKLENTVTMSANEYPSDKVITKTTVIPYLSVAISDSVDPVAMEGPLTYTVTASLSDKAPTAATDVELALKLPQGVDIQAINSDAGICDVGALPKITCSLMDLSLGSVATVNVDVQLKDPGLLVLVPQAEIMATNYPAHSNRERTNISIPEGIEVDIVFVIDVTGSMQGEINGVINAMKQFINEIDPSTAPLIALVVFTDEVKVEAFTRDLEVLLSAITKLQADGGGTCPEASVEALHIAIPHTKPGGDILFATDASPYADANIEAIIEGLRNKGIRFNGIITGDCSQPDSWNQLP